MLASKPMTVVPGTAVWGCPLTVSRRSFICGDRYTAEPMRCPFCAAIEDKVVDTRPSDNEQVIRRRRECSACGRRFTTYERVDEILPLVVKKDDRREPFDRSKILSG